MDPETIDKLKTNLGAAHKMAVNYVMTAAGVMFTVYLALPDDQRQTIVQHLPFPPWMAPILVTVLGIGARLWPQKSITPAEASAKSDGAPQPSSGGRPTTNFPLDTGPAPLPPIQPPRPSQ